VTITDITAAGVGVGVAEGVGVTVIVGNGVGEGVTPGEIVGLGEGLPLLDTIRLGEMTHPAISASNSGAQNRSPAFIKKRLRKKMLHRRALLARTG
jgi:hypothetical protein